MLLLVCGEDTYRSLRKLREIEDAYRAAKGALADVVRVDASEFSIEDLRKIVWERSLFQPKRLMVFHNACQSERLQDGSDELFSFLKETDETIVWHEQGGMPKGALASFLAVHAKVQEYPALSGNLFVSEMKKEANRKGVQFEEDALWKIARHSDSFWQAAQDMSQLVAYAGGALVTARHAEVFLEERLEKNVFGAIEAVAAQDRGKAFMLLHEAMREKDHPLYLLTMLAYQFRSLLAVRSLLDGNAGEQEIVKKSGMSAFAVRKTASLAKRFSRERLASSFRMVCQADKEAKTGVKEPEEALDLLVASV